MILSFTASSPVNNKNYFTSDINKDWILNDPWSLKSPFKDLTYNDLQHLYTQLDLQQQKIDNKYNTIMTVIQTESAIYDAA